MRKNKKDTTRVSFLFLAAELGFEPRHTESESAVLPLHNSAIRFQAEDIITQIKWFVNSFLKFLFAHGEILHFTRLLLVCGAKIA